MICISDLDIELYKSHYLSPFGEITLVSDKENLVALYFKDRQILKCDCDIKEEELKILLDTKRWLKRYFAGQNPDILELSLSPQGSAFQKIVWEILCKIPYGEVKTYGDIAKATAEILNRQKMSPQAVGNAISKNPISIIIPCHRVIGAKNTLIGYVAGIDIKRRLLELEGFKSVLN